MEVIDINAWTGTWSTFPVRGGVSDVRQSLHRAGVERIFLASLNAAWCHNPHYCNTEIYAAASDHADIEPVPVLDPTIVTWTQEVDRARREGVRLVKVLPNYSQYDLLDQHEFLSVLSTQGFVLLVQTRLEDVRRQHPLAQVKDTPATWGARVARDHADLQVVIGGATWKAILDLRADLLELDNLYADVSQADGMDSLRMFVDHGLGNKILFGTHAPLFAPMAGLARVLTDLTDAEALPVLGDNARRLLGAANG